MTSPKAESIADRHDKSRLPSDELNELTTSKPRTPGGVGVTIGYEVLFTDEELDRIEERWATHTAQEWEETPTISNAAKGSVMAFADLLEQVLDLPDLAHVVRGELEMGYPAWPDRVPTRYDFRRWRDADR